MYTKEKDGIELIVPETLEDLYSLIKPVADRTHEALDDSFVVEGNKNITYNDVKNICLLTNWNIGFSKQDLKIADHIDTYYLLDFNIKELIKNKNRDSINILFKADEITVETLGIRFWFD